MNVPDKLISSYSWVDINIYIYYKISESPPSIRDIADEFNIPKTSVQRRLKKLQESGLLGTKVGQKWDKSGTPKALNISGFGSAVGTKVGQKWDKSGTPKKTVDERKKEFIEKLKPYLEKYGKDTLNAFYQYWTQVNEGGTKMLFERQKAFQIPNRLATWHKNNYGSQSKTDVGMVLHDTKDKDYDKGAW